MKKSSANDWDESMNDALFFAYLEGELPEDKAKELEKRLAADPMLESELKCWEEAVIKPEVYNTHLLEKTLLRKEVKIDNRSTSTYIFIIVLLSSLFSFLPIAQEKQVSKHIIPVQKKESTLIPKVEKTYVITLVTPVEAKGPGKKTFSQGSLAKGDVPQQEKNKIFIELEIPPLATAKIVILKTEEKASLLSLPDTNKKENRSKIAPAIRTLTRKERRKIEKMKERARQQRMENNFLKGRVPYVVPLKTNNF